MANLNPRITVEPGKMGEKPCIRGLRFTVYDLASYLASGMSEDKIRIFGKLRLCATDREKSRHGW
jgi:uncharacterized protein (DUF433 family)